MVNKDGSKIMWLNPENVTEYQKIWEKREKSATYSVKFGTMINKALELARKNKDIVEELMK
jgi:hypothetical protein